MYTYLEVPLQGLKIWGRTFWAISRSLKGTCFTSISGIKIGLQILAPSAPQVSPAALQLELCEYVADTKSLPISNMSKTAAAQWRDGGVAGDFDPTHCFSFTFRRRQRGGGGSARLQKITTLQNCPDWDTVKCEKRSISRQGHGTGNHNDIHISWFMLLKQSHSIAITSLDFFLSVMEAFIAIKHFKLWYTLMIKFSWHCIRFNGYVGPPHL